MTAPPDPPAPPLERLDATRIRAALSESGRRHLAALEIHDRLDSTNDHLLRAAAAGAPSGTVCLAECQTAGRGRRGRTWVSPPGGNLYVSLLWRSLRPPAALGGVSLAIGVALAETLETLGARDLTLKWPNDLLWRERKLAGILVEVGGAPRGPAHLVVGLGVNLRMTAGQGAAIDQPWVALDQVLDRVLAGVLPGRNDLAARLLDACLKALDSHERAGLAPTLARWPRFDRWIGRTVEIQSGARTMTGIHRGLAEDGALCLETADGPIRCHAGEVRLRASGEPSGEVQP